MSGQAAIINLNGSTPEEMAVVREYALVINYPRIAFGGGFGGFGGGFGGGAQAVDFDEAVRRRDAQVAVRLSMPRERQVALVGVGVVSDRARPEKHHPVDTAGVGRFHGELGAVPDRRRRSGVHRSVPAGGCPGY